LISASHEFENRESLAKALALHVAQGLSRAISQKGHGVLAVSGGTTPKLFFEHLSHQDISWNKVIVTLVDERQVPDDSPRSNAKLVKENLLVNQAAAARFVPLFRNETAAQDLVLDCVVLGMGNDGHTASFFPGGDHLAAALHPQSTQSIYSMSAAGAGELRLTFSLRKLLEAATLCLHIEGQEKKSTLARALDLQGELALPVRSVLTAPRPIAIFWCP
jgi:6-phosphogluconolactonase